MAGSESHGSNAWDYLTAAQSWQTERRTVSACVNGQVLSRALSCTENKKGDYSSENHCRTCDELVAIKSKKKKRESFFPPHS